MTLEEARKAAIEHVAVVRVDDLGRRRPGTDVYKVIELFEYTKAKKHGVCGVAGGMAAVRGQHARRS